MRKQRYLSLGNNDSVKSLSLDVSKVSLFLSFRYKQKEYFSLMSHFLDFCFAVLANEMFKELCEGDGVAFCLPWISSKWVWFVNLGTLLEEPSNGSKIQHCMC